MFHTPAPAKSNSVRSIAVAQSYQDGDRARSGLLEGELLDLYAALLIVVPVGIFLKSLWF